MKNINKNEAQMYIYQLLHNQYRQGEYEQKNDQRNGVTLEDSITMMYPNGCC